MLAKKSWFIQEQSLEMRCLGVSCGLYGRKEIGKLLRGSSFLSIEFCMFLIFWMSLDGSSPSTIMDFLDSLYFFSGYLGRILPCTACIPKLLPLVFQ